jgi:magnesium chelatase family protein
MIQRYVGKISGPLMDRIDIHIDVPAVKFDELRGRNVKPGEPSEEIRTRVIRAREIQLARFGNASFNSHPRTADSPARNNGNHGVYSNSAMTPAMIRQHCALDAESESLLEKAMHKQGLSARAHDRILKVARTIADLTGCNDIEPRHISEAINYRSLDRNYWT